MIKPQDGEMNYKDIDELKFEYMFISACLTEDQRNKLKETWELNGGHKTISWWKFVMENTKIELDIR